MEYIYKNQFGTFVTKSSDEIEVNGEISWSIKFSPNNDILCGSSIKIVFPAFKHQTSHEYVQTYDYWKENYIIAYCDDQKTHISVDISKIESSFTAIKRWPDSNRIATITIDDLMPTDSNIIITFGGIDKPFLSGYTKPSSVGINSMRKNGTFLKYITSIKVGEDYEAVRILPDIKIIPSQASILKIFTPSITRPNEKINVKCLVTDRFNNPIFDYDTQALDLVLIDLKTSNKSPFHGYLPYKGYFILTAEDFNDLDIRSAPILCTDTALKIFWGDLHAHSSITANINDSNLDATPENAYEYARYVAMLDFFCLSEQTFSFNDDETLNITNKKWQDMCKICDEHNDSPEFTTYTGFETHSPRGDTITMFAKSLSYYAYPNNNVYDVPDIWEYYKELDVLTIPHFHRYSNGRKSKDQHDIKYGFNPLLWKNSSSMESLCEVFSGQWGRFENFSNPMILKARFNVLRNTVFDFLCLGKKWGFTSSSDCHDAMPGYSGLTGVVTDNNNRSSIYDSLSKRRTIATTNTRVAMLFEKKDKYISLAIVAPCKMVSLYLVTDITEDAIKIDNYYFEDEYLIADFAECRFLYLRIQLEDGHIVWASPIFFD